jgi:rfaE bifunctional protein kinase chain/domain
MAAPVRVPDRDQVAGARVLVVGDLMLDRYWFGAVDRISPEAPVPVVRIEREEARLGGAGNVALNISRLGAPSCLLSAVGRDEAGAQLRELLTRHGVRARLGDDETMRTVVKLRVIGRAQQLLRIDHESQPDHEVLAALNDGFALELPHCDLVLFSDYGKGGLSHIAAMIGAARAAGKPVLVDPKGSDWSRYSGASLITPNRAELAQAVGQWHSEADLDQRVAALRSRFDIAALLCTRSEDGMTLFDGAPPLHVAAHAREVFDVTGAGDTVIAVLAVLVAAGLPLRDAVVHANRAAGIVVGRFGTASVSYEELFT